MKPPFTSMLMAGFGQMGRALLLGWQKQGILAPELAVIEPDAARGTEAARLFGARIHSDTAGLPESFRPQCILLAVKPQSLDAILPYYDAFLGPDTLVLSIAAGKSLAYFSGTLGSAHAVVRAMPNTPALVGEGMTVLVAGRAVTPAQREKAALLMGAVGRTEWLEDEALMDAVTALSGSGPAYLFLFLEAVAEAGVKAGLPPELARTLALQTVKGSVQLAASSAESFEKLRQNVTSPGGTTEAALTVLANSESGMKILMKQAIDCAIERSKQL